MRILHAISTLSSVAGGPPRAAIALARAVAALGHEVILHAADHAMSDADRSLIAGIHDPGLKIVVHQHLAPGGLTRHASVGLWRALAKEIPNVDVVHLHNLYVFHDWVVWRECRRAGVPYVLAPHGTLDPLIYARHRWRKALFERLYQKKIIEDATLMHFTSEAEQELAQPFVFGRPGAVVPLGVDLESFNTLPPADSFRAQYKEIGDRRIILFLGRLNFKKGIEILVPAFAAAAARRDDIHLVFAGSDGGFERTARALVREYGIAERTTFTGHLTPERVSAAYAAAYMFVLPSHTENFGLAPAEAMAAGVPSLLSARVDVAHAAVTRGACRVVPLNSADWTAAILDLLAHPDAAQAMSERARAYARSAFSWEIIAKELVAMYERAISLSRLRTSLDVRQPAVSPRLRPISAGVDGRAATPDDPQAWQSRGRQRLRVLHVISTLSPAAGGPPVAVLGMARAVAALGHDVTIATTDHGMSEAQVRSAILSGGNGVRIIVRRHLPPGALTRHASIGLWRSLAAEIPMVDVVHLHSLYLFHGWVVWRECRRAGVPYILRPHGTLDPYIMHFHRYRKTIFDWSLQNRITRDATLIHFTSEAERDLARPSVFGRPGAVVPLGVDLSRFAMLPPPDSFRAQFPEIGNRRIVLFLGRLNFKKGIEILVPAFAAAAAARDDIHLVLAGPDGGFEATARALVNEYGIAARTTFTGHLSLDRVAAAYAAASMFALPSYTENFGLAPAEAMAAGVPSLLSNRVDVAHAAVGHGACRVVPLIPADWTAAILDLLENPEATEAMGRAASAYARSTFSWSTIARQLVELYEQALAVHVDKARKKNPNQAISAV